MKSQRPSSPRSPSRSGSPRPASSGPARSGKPSGPRSPTGSRSEKPERTQRKTTLEKPERTQRKVTSEKPERTEKSDRFARPEKPSREKPSRDTGSRGKPTRSKDSSFKKEAPARREAPAKREAPFRKEDAPKRESSFQKSEDKPTGKPAGKDMERGERSPRKDFEKNRDRNAPRSFFIWGRRPVDSFLGKLAEGKFGEALESTSTEKILGSSALFLMGDTAGKVPSQFKDTVDLATNLGIKIRICKGHEDESWPLPPDEGLQHQRVALSVPSYPTDSLYDLDLQQGAKGCVGIVLDQVQDPRNFGAILRSAAFFGCSFAVYGEDRQAPLTSTVLKASAGGAFSLQLSPVVNLNRALKHFKDKGLWIIGSSLADTSVDLKSVPLDRPYVLVLGNEGKGLRQEIANKCDYLVKIPGGSSTLDSLNVSVACGILLERLQTSKSK